MKLSSVQALNGGTVNVCLSNDDEIDDLGPFMQSGCLLMRMYCMRKNSRIRIGLYRRNQDGVYVYQGAVDIGLKDGLHDITASLIGDLMHLGQVKNMPDDPNSRGVQFFGVQAEGLPMKAIQAYFGFNRRVPVPSESDLPDDDRIDDDPHRRTHNDQ